MNFPFTLQTLILGKHPDISSDTRVVEKVHRQSNDCFNQVIFQHPAADLALAGCSPAGEQRTAVFDDSGTAKVIVHFIDSRLQKQHLHIARARKARTPATVEALYVFIINCLLHTFCCIFTSPGCTEGWVFNNETHLGSLESVSFHRVLIANVFCVLTFNHHLSQADRI